MRRALGVGLALSLLSLSCDDGPTSGELGVELNTPRRDLGAVMFSIEAPQSATIDSVTASCAGCSVYLARVSASEVRGVLLGQSLGGPILRVQVSDVSLASAFEGLVLEAATEANAAVPVTGFRLTVSQ